MGLLDCVASPEERERFEESRKPFPRTGEFSKSEHDISRRRGIPLFASQGNLKNVQDIDFWRGRVLRFLFSTEGPEDVRVLKLPLKQLGYVTVTDFIEEIPPEQFSEFISQPPPDEGLLKGDKAFWVHDGIAEPGIFRWIGAIDNVSIIGLQLDRKKAVPFGIHDGKGLFYCKPGHRALVQEHEVTPYKKFLRSFLGLPPKKDSLAGMRESVRFSAKAVAAKNAKAGDRIYLPKEKQWTTVQWIGKIDGETVVDLVYDRPKPEAGQPVAPDEPCISRSISLADLIGAMASEPNTPVTVQPQQTISTPLQTHAPPSKLLTPNPPPPPPPPPPDTPRTPLPESSDESTHSAVFGDASEDDSEEEDSDASDTDETQSNSSEGESYYADEDNRKTASTGHVALQAANEPKETEMDIIVTRDELSPTIPPSTKKGMFGFRKKKQPNKPSPVYTGEKKTEFVSMPELKHEPTTPRLRNSGIFSSWGFKKNSKPKMTFDNEGYASPKQEKRPPPSSPKKKPAVSSSWGGLFKSKSKTQLQKLDMEEATSSIECSTPIDEMFPPDKIPTPPPKSSLQPVEVYNERRIDLPEYLNFPVTPSEEIQSEPSPTRHESITSECGEESRDDVSPDSSDHSSESASSDSEEEEEEQNDSEENVAVELHLPPSPPPPPSPLKRQMSPSKMKEIKITTLEKEIVQKVEVQDKKGVKTPTDKEPYSPGEDGDGTFNYVPSSIERFKESKIRNRPTSFGSFLARIKNIKSDGSVAGSPTTPVVSPVPTTSPEQIRSPDRDPRTTPSNSPHVHDESSDSGNRDESDDGKERSIETPGGAFEIQKSLVKPQVGVQSVKENEGNQEEIMLDFLDVKERTPPTATPPPLPATGPPKRKTSRNRSFTFNFTGKRKPSQPQTPTTPTPNQEQHQRNSDEERTNSMYIENVEPRPEESPKKNEEVEKERKQSLSSSFRNSFRRTFSLTKNKKNAFADSDLGSPTSPKTPTSSISKPRPVTVYIDNEAAVQARDSFKKQQRPNSLVLDIKPWNSRHGKRGSDIYSSPSSDEGQTSPSSKSPNSALLPKQSDSNVPKHRIFTTPSFFKKVEKKSDTEPLISNTTPTNNSISNRALSPTSRPNVTTPVNEQTSPKLEELPQADVLLEAPGGKLKSALKQRKEIEFIPKGLKIGDRVLWYSAKGPVPGTVQRLFKDGTDKYTAMVKFDREVLEEPLQLVREGDAYIVTVEELITPDMFEPLYENQSVINSANETIEPITPTPSVRFNGVAEKTPVPQITVTGGGIPEVDDHDLPPPFQEEEVTLACGFRRGIQCRDKSCCLETILFSLFYTTNAFDITMLYANTPNEDALTQQVRRILRREIVDPLRREGFCPWFAVKKLRDAVKPLSDEWQTLSTDAEVMMFILFDRALKLQKFISYSNGMSDFLHQLVVDTKDLSKSTTVQHLFQTSLQMMDKLKLKTVPTPALILEMPRSNDQLIQYKAVIPNMSLNISQILDGETRLCICGVIAKYECKTCTNNAGVTSIVYCDNCKDTADAIHFKLPHDAQLSPLHQLPPVILDLSAIVCVEGGHYFSFMKCGQQQNSPWVFFDGAESENPKVCIEQNLSMWLDRLEKYPGRYQEALQYPLLTHILQDSHICIYQPREKSSSV